LDLPPEIAGIYLIISIAYLKASLKGDDPFGRSQPPPGPVEDSQRNSDDERKYKINIILNYTEDKKNSR
ncbi:hypothetical protein OFB99_25535, partial [Escherichia coli]|nr:hypothetical protein [Escherichia coli]